MDLIDRQAAIDALTTAVPITLYDVIRVFEALPTIDAVPVGAYEQTRWERDTAIEQLAEIGKSLCEKMDNVATVVRCKDCKYYDESVMFSPQKMCFRLKDKNCKVIGYNFAEDDFCSYWERSEE